MLRVERVEEGPAKQTRRKKTGEGSEVREGVSQCQRAKDNSTLNPQKPIGALELLSQREGGAAKGAGSLARVMQLQTVSRSSAHPEKAGFWLAAGDAPAWALWIKGTLQGLRLDARALCLAHAGTEGITSLYLVHPQRSNRHQDVGEISRCWPRHLGG